MFCPMCGASNADDSTFCGNCGVVLKPDQAPVAAEEKAPQAETGPEPGGSQPAPWLEEVMAGPPLPPPPPPAPSPRGRPPVAVAPSAPTSGMAVASLLLGIGGLTVLPLLGSIAAIILGYIARSEIRRRPLEISGDGLALAGIVLGWISIGLAVLGLLVFGGITVCGLCGAFGASSGWSG